MLKKELRNLRPGKSAGAERAEAAEARDVRRALQQRDESE